MGQLAGPGCTRASVRDGVGKGLDQGSTRHPAEVSAPHALCAAGEHLKSMREGRLLLRRQPDVRRLGFTWFWAFSIWDAISVLPSPRRLRIRMPGARLSNRTTDDGARAPLPEFVMRAGQSDCHEQLQSHTAHWKRSCMTARAMKGVQWQGACLCTKCPDHVSLGRAQLQLQQGTCWKCCSIGM